MQPTSKEKMVLINLSIVYVKYHVFSEGDVLFFNSNFYGDKNFTKALFGKYSQQRIDYEYFNNTIYFKTCLISKTAIFFSEKSLDYYKSKLSSKGCSTNINIGVPINILL